MHPGFSFPHQPFPIVPGSDERLSISAFEPDTPPHNPKSTRGASPWTLHDQQLMAEIAGIEKIVPSHALAGYDI